MKTKSVLQMLGEMASLSLNCGTYTDMSGINEALADKFCKCLDVNRFKTVTYDGSGRYKEFHDRLLGFKNVVIGYSSTGDKIGAIKALREYAQGKGDGKLGLKYTKDYVEWVWGYPNTTEPKFW